KPTVIDVDIYVNSIGPVSSINMLFENGTEMLFGGSTGYLMTPKPYDGSYNNQESRPYTLSEQYSGADSVMEVW
ncbi:hypothetical protein STEG23_005025, partial [Scotinomys teguina]